MGYEASFFDDKSYLLLKDITDLIIPATDTAGALDIGVHRFIDIMLSEWASNETKNKYQNGLNLINEFVVNRYRKSFINCSIDDQKKILIDLDNGLEKNELSAFFADLKWFVISGYYTSE